MKERFMGRCMPDWQRGRDVLGEETDEMLRDRMQRSLDVLNYKGQRLPYEPRQGPAQLDARELKHYAFKCELAALCERYGVSIACAGWDGGYAFDLEGEIDLDDLF